MSVEVVTPEAFAGDVMGNLSSRRGHIEGMEPRGNAQVIRAKVPLSEMFGYSTDLRSRTQGRAVYTMQFRAYEQVPKSVADEIVAKMGSRRPGHRRDRRPHGQHRRVPEQGDMVDDESLVEMEVRSESPRRHLVARGAGGWGGGWVGAGGGGLWVL